MTEIKVKKIEVRKGVHKFCVVDNHYRKKSTSYQIIYKSDNAFDVTNYMVEKGIWT